MFTTTYPDQSQPTPAADEPIMVFRAPDSEAALPLSRVLEVLDLVELVRMSAGSLAPDQLSQLVRFSDRIDLKIVTPGDARKQLEIVPAEKELLDLLLAQASRERPTPSAQSASRTGCPGCQAVRTELLLLNCPDCGYDFRLAAGVTALWQPVGPRTE